MTSSDAVRCNALACIRDSLRELRDEGGHCCAREALGWIDCSKLGTTASQLARDEGMMRPSDTDVCRPLRCMDEECPRFPAVFGKAE